MCIVFESYVCVVDLARRRAELTYLLVVPGASEPAVSKALMKSSDGRDLAALIEQFRALSGIVPVAAVRVLEAQAFEREGQGKGSSAAP